MENLNIKWLNKRHVIKLQDYQPTDDPGFLCITPETKNWYKLLCALAKTT